MFDGRGATANLVDDQKRHLLVRRVVDQVVTDVLAQTEARIGQFKIDSLDSMRHSAERLCCYSPQMEIQIRQLKQFLREHLYRHPKLGKLSEQAKEIITTLYNRLNLDLSGLPRRYQEMLQTERQEIVVADYIAGMTDRYAERAASTQ